MCIRLSFSDYAFVELSRIPRNLQNNKNSIEFIIGIVSPTLSLCMCVCVCANEFSPRISTIFFSQWYSWYSNRYRRDLIDWTTV